LDEFDRRLTAVEGQVRTHEDRMENLEYRFELETSYRYIRIENSPGLDQMFKDLAAKTMENSEIRERTGQVLMREIREVLEREVDEGQLQATSQTNNARRKWHPPAVRKATLDALNLAPLVDLCSRAGDNRYNLRMQQGEPSRVAFTAIKNVLNWALYIYSQHANGEQYKLQVFPDRGPAVRRRKGYGKGKEGKGKDGKGKGGKGKGKGKGKAGGNQEG
jgi:hypothetical protein